MKSFDDRSTYNSYTFGCDLLKGCGLLKKLTTLHVGRNRSNPFIDRLALKEKK